MSARRPLLEPAFVTFLSERLAEERGAATRRGARGDEVDMVDELLWELEQGEPLDKMSLDLLVLAYARHDDFDPSWNRWLAA